MCHILMKERERCKIYFFTSHFTFFIYFDFFVESRHYGAAEV